MERKWLQLAVLTAAVLFCGIVGLSRAEESENADGSKRAELRVGVYDSRAICIAYAPSKMHAAEMKQLHEAYEKARADGDEKEIQRIEAEAEARQRRFHLQGFGTAPVDDILARIDDKLPEIARRARVDLIVSKWAIDYAASDAEMVDITDALVEPFEPSQRTRKILAQLPDTPPISAEEIEKHEH